MSVASIEIFTTEESAHVLEAVRKATAGIDYIDDANFSLSAREFGDVDIVVSISGLFHAGTEAQFLDETANETARRVGEQAMPYLKGRSLQVVVEHGREIHGLWSNE